jgi:hypothetical protein
MTVAVSVPANLPVCRILFADYLGTTRRLLDLTAMFAITSPRISKEFLAKSLKVGSVDSQDSA